MHGVRDVGVTYSYTDANTHHHPDANADGARAAYVYAHAYAYLAPGRFADAHAYVQLGRFGIRRRRNPGEEGVRNPFRGSGHPLSLKIKGRFAEKA